MSCYLLFLDISYYFSVFLAISWCFLLFLVISWYFLQFLSISWYFLPFLVISCYFLLFLVMSRYFLQFLVISSYFSLFLYISCYFLWFLVIVVVILTELLLFLQRFCCSARPCRYLLCFLIFLTRTTHNCKINSELAFVISIRNSTPPGNSNMHVRSNNEVSGNEERCFGRRDVWFSA